MYQAVCDKCGEKLRHPHWGLVLKSSPSIDFFKDYLNCEGWKEINGKLYCSNCKNKKNETF